MYKFSRGSVVGAALVAASLLPGATASADETGVKAGVLRCDVGSGVGFIFGSTKDVDCLYSPGGDRPTEKYVGEIKKFGVDIGYSESGVMIWAVLAPSTDVKAGALAGTYAGATAEAAAGAGVGANVLVGGGKSISLQPLSISGAKGINVAAGLGVLDLKSAE